jgi:isopentenyldiphosphate isomerase
MAEEYLDILNEKGELTGQSRTYNEAHEKGLIHRTAHVWILNSKKELLIQKRASDRRAYPDFWDISAAGHISAGQTSLEGAKRETQEELGLFLSDNIFKYLFTVQEHIILNQGTYINNEFQDVYLVCLDILPEKIKFDKEEVSEIKWVSIDEFKLLISKEEYKMVPHEEEYRCLLDYLKK